MITNLADLESLESLIQGSSSTGEHELEVLAHYRGSDRGIAVSLGVFQGAQLNAEDWRRGPVVTKGSFNAAALSSCNHPSTCAESEQRKQHI